MWSRFVINDYTVGIIKEFNNRYRFMKRVHEYVDAGYLVKWKRHPFVLDVLEEPK